MTAAERTGVLFVLALLFCAGLGPAAVAAQESSDSAASPASEANPLMLQGKWLRPDGGYVLELRDVGFSGTVTAAYFNPKPINVSRAAWRLEEGFVTVAVELRDVNYPGSTYTLAYLPDRDVLAGYYYQAVQGQTFEVVFARMEKHE